MPTHVAEAEIVELLQQMIRAQTVNPPAQTAGCASVLCDVLAQEGIAFERVEGKPGLVNVVATLAGNKPGKRLIFNGHIDTVPAGDNWTVDPFGGELRDGYVWGRGSCDMKSGVAAMLMAMVELKRSGQQFAGEIQLQAVADEETGSRWGTLHLIDRGYCKDADFAICTEPTSNRVELGNRGLRWIDVTVAGIASHAGRPQLGVNAVQIAAAVIRQLEQLSFELRDERFEIPAPSLTVTTIQGGHTVNVVPDSCSFSVDRRMLPGETEAQVLAELEAAIAPVRDRYGVGIDIVVRPGAWDPYTIAQDEPVALAAIVAERAVVGEQVAPAYKAACTDASHLVTRAGIPTVLLGPGNEKLSHKADERVAVEALVAGVEIYSQVSRTLLVQG